MNHHIDKIRDFNRFYTSHLGILNNQFLDSPYSLSEIRVLYEINGQKNITAKDLCQLLGLDKGYLSRILKLFDKKDIIKKVTLKTDRRSYQIDLTAKGKKLLDMLQKRSNGQIGDFTDRLDNWEKTMLVGSMSTIKDLLSIPYDKKKLAQNVVYRQGLRPGDIGYLIHLHGSLYAEESGYSQKFESYVAKTFYESFENYSEEKDRIWLAEYNNRIIGCIAILHRPKNEAQLRWFLVHPVFRGSGIGKKLFKEAIDFSKEKGYQNIYLFTTDVQKKAIAMYEKKGFCLTNSVEVEQWGHTFHEERYDLYIVNKI